MFIAATKNRPQLMLLAVILSFVVLGSAQAPPQPPKQPSTRSQTKPPRAAEAPVAVPPVFLAVDPGGRNFRFVVFGDLRTAPVSNVTDTDPARRKAILDAIANEKPAFVAISGDLVLAGGNDENWVEWDNETAAWAKAKIPVLPALGNHEIYGDPAKALPNYFRHFPKLKGNHYYSARAGNVQVLTLDSNLPELTGPQSVWLKTMLDDLAPDVDFVLIMLHHPPYTHSQPEALGGHPPRATEIALASWLEEKQKSLRAKLLVVAGHVHNYERYEHNGVMYVVSGGGGAAPYNIPRMPTDLYREAGPSYHYCTVDVRGNKLAMEMRKLELVGGKAIWRVADKFELTVPPRPVPPPGHLRPAQRD